MLVAFLPNTIGSYVIFPEYGVESDHVKNKSFKERNFLALDREKMFVLKA